MKMKTTTTALLMILALTLADATPASAQDTTANGSDRTSSEGGVTAWDVAQRLSVGVDYRARSNIFSVNPPEVARVSVEAALVEPELGQSGPRFDLFVGVGSAEGFYIDGGARLGWEWGFDNGLALGLGYDVSVSREDALYHSGWYSPSYTVEGPVLLNHRVGVEFGGQTGPRLRAGAGVHSVAGYASIDHAEVTSPELDAGMIDAGVVWRF